MSDLLLSADALIIPSSEGRAITLDMRKVHKAESRLVELNGITKAKAGELLYCFIEAFGEAKDHLATLRGEYGRAKQRVRRARGVIVLDKAADKLKDKGLARAAAPAGSEDMRDACVDTDEIYQKVHDQFCQVEAAVESMEGKVEKLKMAYYSVGELIKGPDFARRDTSGGAGDEEPGSYTQREKIQRFVEEVANTDVDAYAEAGFGTPKF